MIDECLDLSLNIDPSILAHLRCVDPGTRQLKYDHFVVGAITSATMAQHTNFPIQWVSYEDFRSHLPAVFVLSQNAQEDWLPQSLRDDGATMQPDPDFPGDHFTGQLYLVTGPPLP